jgi:hypothetical protein
MIEKSWLRVSWFLLQTSYTYIIYHTYPSNVTRVLNVLNTATSVNLISDLKDALTLLVVFYNHIMIYYNKRMFFVLIVCYAIINQETYVYAFFHCQKDDTLLYKYLNLRLHNVSFPLINADQKKTEKHNFGNNIENITYLKLIGFTNTCAHVWSPTQR